VNLTMAPTKYRYRIAINNNFRKLYAYLDFKYLGAVIDFTAFAGTSASPNEGESADSIGIYLNFKLFCLTKSNEEARRALNKLISECPEEAKTDIQNYQNILFSVFNQRK
jgi:hypothetical protein